MNMDISNVAELIVGIMVTLQSWGLLRLGRQVSEISRTRIINDPLGVKVERDYATREECAACMRETKSEMKEMKALYDKIVTLLMERDERSVDRTKAVNDNLSEKISALGEQLHARITRSDEEGAERRRRIHDKLNEHQDKITAIHIRTEVSKDIGKLGSAIMTLAKKDTGHAPA